MRTGVRTLTLRELNRALLARQLLLERRRVPVLESIERLACLQGQWAPSPFVALWSRLARFERDHLAREVERGRIVKATLMRATLHLVSAREYAAYSLATMEGRFGAWRPTGGPELKELEQVHASVLAFARTPRTREEIRAHIAGQLPTRARRDERLRNWFLWAAITTSGIVWDPAGARFEYRQIARHVTPPAALRRKVRPEAAYDLVVRRHLGAFGPATVADISVWSSVRVPNIRAALDRIKGLRRFVDDRGRELVDLPKAPLPDPETPAPVRFLARFDAAILGHAAPERTRILPEAYRKQVIFAAEVWPAFLVDGFVAGRWSVSVRPKEALIELRPFKPLARATKTALVEEGERLARFYAPESKMHGVRA